MFGWFVKPHTNLIVKEIVFTWIYPKKDSLGISGLAEIMVGKRFLPYEFVLKCNLFEVTTEQVKNSLESISCEQYIHNYSEFMPCFEGSYCDTEIGSFHIAKPTLETMSEYGWPKRWRRHKETFCYCNKNTTKELIVSKSKNEKNIIMCCNN